MESFRTQIQHWNKQYDSFAKLQHIYAATAVATLLVAGVVSLINYQLGQSILFIAVCAVLIFVANGVVWALIRTFLSPQSISRKK